MTTLQPDPLICAVTRHARGFCGKLHQHPRGQLLHAIDAPARVTLAGGSVAMRRGDMLWLPTNLPHAVSATGACVMASGYLRVDLAAALSHVCCRIEPRARLSRMMVGLTEAVSPPAGDALMALLPGLMADLIGVSGDDPEPGSSIPNTLLTSPAPRSEPMLQAICRALIDDPSDGRTLDQWADALSTSRRTLERKFCRATGTGFDVWRRGRRVRAAVQMLVCGVPIKRVAWQVGYDSVSAFSAMFRAVTGTSPAAFRAGLA